MATYSDLELKILDRLTEVIDSSLWLINYNNADKDRMLFATCINDEEKDILTKKEVKKMQKRIAKCPPNVAGYISVFLSEIERENHDGDFYDYRKRISRNFISAYSENIKELAIEFDSVEKIPEEDYMSFKFVLFDNDYGFDKKEIKNFIKYMGLAERLSIFKTLLEQVERDNKEPELNDIIDKMQAKADADNQKKIKDSLSEILDNLRGQQISSLQLFKIIRDNTGLDRYALEYLKEDIGWYLFSMKTAQNCFYSNEQVEKELNKIKAKGYSEEKLFELGYLKNKRTYFGNEYIDPDEPVYVNREKLLYPAEFTSIEYLLEIVNKEIVKIDLKDKLTAKAINSFDNIVDVRKQEYIIKLLEDLSITKNGISILSSRKKGALRGVVEALREENILPHLGIDKLCNSIANQIGLELKSKLDFSDISQKFQKDTKQYIKDNPLH